MKARPRQAPRSEHPATPAGPERSRKALERRSLSAAAGAPGEFDEEALAEALDPGDRRALGAWFTPAPIVARVLALVSGHLPAGGPTRVIDPACGAGAFLSAAAMAFPSAAIAGLELHPASAEKARARLPHARIAQADALGPELARHLPPASDDAFELWLGNPPYNGTSRLLKDPGRWRALCDLVPGALPRGTSLRDDYAFFLLRAAERLSLQRGALAFITSATLLDAYLYGPLRRHLLAHLQLREVELLPAGTFRGVQVRTCITVWTSPKEAGAAALLPARLHGEGGVQPFVPEEPELRLLPVPGEARALDAAWRTHGEPLDELVPVSFTGLKTRFDELLVDASKARLSARVRAFLRTPPDELERFALAHAIPPQHLTKLRALKASPGVRSLRFDPQALQPFFRFKGARHARGIPRRDRAYCYVDRELIPRGDHRLQGRWNPHAEPLKLVFNLRERPLVSTVVEGPGAVTAWRHARFAPLHVPVDPRNPEGPRRLNLSERGQRAAERLGGPHALLLAIARFIQSAPVQTLWAPAYATSRVLPVPVDLLQADGSLGREAHEGPPPHDLAAGGIESRRPQR